MISPRKPDRCRWRFTPAAICGLVGCLSLFAQDLSPEQQVAKIREAAARSQVELSGYKWQEEETVTVKDKVQSRRLFEVQLDAGGRMRRTMLGLPDENLSPGSESRGMREWVAQKKKRETITYSQDMKQLAETYTRLDNDLLHLARERGDLAVHSVAGRANIKILSVKNYVKPGDSVVLTLNQESNEIESAQISSYLASTQEPVHILAEFSKARDAPAHIDLMEATAAKKHLSLSIRNQSYQRITPNANR
jgi:hypothetical protein